MNKKEKKKKRNEEKKRKYKVIANQVAVLQCTFDSIYNNSL